MKLRIYTYKAPFKKPFVLAGHHIAEREGILFELHDEKAPFPFWSEAAPLPGFSSETLAEVIEWCDASGDWQKWLLSEQPPKYEEEIPSSLRFALSALWFERQASLSYTGLEHFLSEGRAHKSININKAIGLGEPDEILQATKAAVAEGYQTLKYKVGADTIKELEAIAKVREAYPALNIRLDANGAWDVDTAKDALIAFQPLDIEYCEQPLPPGDDDADAWLRNQTFIPIAADESVRTFQQARKLILDKMADVLIIKPMLIGSLTAYIDILKLAEGSGVKVVVTTSLESGVGRRITAKLASMIRFAPHAHGLATGSMFANGADPWPDQDLIRNGTYHVSEITPCKTLKTSPELLHEIKL
ncbi:MAG: o-succinylbenzoate synthase [Balneolia bacterium]|nr:o-succinylbenzoate synthase [Balneolia bacterium]